MKLKKALRFRQVFIYGKCVQRPRNNHFEQVSFIHKNYLHGFDFVKCDIQRLKVHYYFQLKKYIDKMFTLALYQLKNCVLRKCIN